MSPPKNERGPRRRLALSAAAILLTYLVAEITVSVYAYFSWMGTSLFLFEDAGRTWQFDPVRGYRLTSTPSRWMRITNGTVEYVGSARGNSQGFPDRDDFGPERTSPSRPRVAVFGDSFTAAQFLGQNWPDRAEDLAREKGEPIELLNFAVDGAGLANWWSVLVRLVDAEHYELDGAVFAVYGDDLRRKFTVMDERGRSHYSLSRLHTWDPESYPATLEAAQPLFIDTPDSYNLPSEEFEHVLQGQWPSAAGARFRPFIASKAAWAVERAYKRVTVNAPAPTEADNQQRQTLIHDMAASLKRRQIPVLVVYIPDHSRPAPGQADDTKAFAAALDATFVDGDGMYAGLSASEARKLHLPYDGHWNQAGENRFAAFVLPHLSMFKRK